MISLNNKGFQDKIDKNEDFIIYKKVKKDRYRSNQKLCKYY